MKAAKQHGGKSHRKAGGPMIDSGREEKEEKEMDEGRAKGGKVDDKAKRKRGGGVEYAEGGMAKGRNDRPRRKAGGGVGSDKRPFTSAATTKPADGHANGDNETVPE